MDLVGGFKFFSSVILLFRVKWFYFKRFNGLHIKEMLSYGDDSFIEIVYVFFDFLFIYLHLQMTITFGRKLIHFSRDKEFLIKYDFTLDD